MEELGPSHGPFHSLLQLSPEWVPLHESTPMDTDGRSKTTDVCSAEGSPRCYRCGGEIMDRYYLKVADFGCWHENCLRCDYCDLSLSDCESKSCFVRSNSDSAANSTRIYCKEDYLRLFGPKCFNCGQPIQRNDHYHRCPPNFTFHVGCFKCQCCQRPLNQGDRYLCRDGQLLCENDFLQSSSMAHRTRSYSGGKDHYGLSGSGEGRSTSTRAQIDCSASLFQLHHPAASLQPGLLYEPQPIRQHPGQAALITLLPSFVHTHIHLPSHHHHHPQSRYSSKRSMSKRPRTILNAQQRKAFKHAFDRGAKPSRKVREQLARETGLSVRVVQVWFQNQRAKTKKEHRKQDSCPTATSHREEGGGRNSPTPALSTSTMTINANTEVDAAGSPLSSVDGQGGDARYHRPHYENFLLMPTDGGIAGGDASTNSENPINRLYDLHNSYFSPTTSRTAF